MGAHPVYDREQALRHRLNRFFAESLSLPEQDYYARLDAASLLRLKSALSDINNIMTLKVTLAFVDWVVARLSLDGRSAAELRSSVLEAKPSSNGYDIRLGHPVAFVGEVKCNVPINNGAVYGSAQRIGIEKDVAALLNGKRKASLAPGECLKFMAFLDTPEIRQANAHLVRTSKVCREHLVFPGEADGIVRHDVVHGVYPAMPDGFVRVASGHCLNRARRPSGHAGIR